MSPTLIIITAIAARNNDAIFANAFEPPSPINLISLLALNNTIKTIIKFNIIDNMVARYPWLSIKIKIVVNAAGPIISGIPSGTTPILAPGFLLPSDEDIISEIEMIKSIIPPAILKSSIVIPKNSRTSLPPKRKTFATTNAAKTASII